MQREYIKGITSEVVMFIGEEVENTPMKGEPTLFVVGLIPVEEILKMVERFGIQHIYLGANHSFSITLPNGKSVENAGWDHVIKTLLDKDYWVTLDYDIKYHEWVIESCYNEKDRFISMISVKLPYIDQLNYNACVKIDDKDFRATNTGVWIHPVHDLQDKDKYTDWSKYTKDEIIK